MPDPTVTTEAVERAALDEIRVNIGRTSSWHHRRYLREQFDALVARAERGERLEVVATTAEEVLDWIAAMPNAAAVDAACHAEAVQVESAMGAESEHPWAKRSEESKRHWRSHVGPAVKAAFDKQREEYPPHPVWRLRSALMAFWTEGRHAFDPNTGRCRCGQEWICDMTADAALSDTPVPDSSTADTGDNDAR